MVRPLCPVGPLGGRRAPSTTGAHLSLRTPPDSFTHLNALLRPATALPVFLPALAVVPAGVRRSLSRSPHRSKLIPRRPAQRPSLQAIWPRRASTSSLRGESTTSTAYSFPPSLRRLGRLRRRRQALGIESESNTKYSVALENSGDESRERPQVSGIRRRFGRGLVDRFAMRKIHVDVTPGRENLPVEW